MPPAEFIPVAEETGVIARIGEWVIEQACHGALALENALGKPLIVSVNASALQLREHNFCDRLTGILNRTGLNPRSLELEITESVLMDPRGDFLRTLNSLGALGVRLALDDFGTGYSSLSYLHRFPVQTLKIDQSFVQGAQSVAGSAAIVRAVIALGHSLNLKVVAEGIENAEEVALLRALQCDEGQGHFFARPMPLAELLSHFKEMPLAKLVGVEEPPRHGDVASAT